MVKELCMGNLVAQKFYFAPTDNGSFNAKLCPANIIGLVFRRTVINLCTAIEETGTILLYNSGFFIDLAGITYRKEIIHITIFPAKTKFSLDCKDVNDFAHYKFF